MGGVRVNLNLGRPLNVTKARFTFVVAGGDYFQI